MKTPIPEFCAELVEECAELRGGVVADYIPELALADPELSALALCTPDGTVYAAGDAEHEFTIQSISKPFAYALALRDRGLDEVLAHVGVEPSGESFNQISLEASTGRPRNPMINIGAITTHCLTGNQGLSPENRAAAVLEGMSAFAGRDLGVDERVCESEFANRYRNMALASMVRSNGLIDCEPLDAVAGYTRQCSALVSVRDLAIMAMTLASGGVNPLTGHEVVPRWVARQVLAVMTTCGMYDAAGDWLSTVGIPAKSGVAGGILGALPGQVGIGTFSPRLDEFGNSVRGVRLCEMLSEHMGLHMMEAPAPSIDAIGSATTTTTGARLVQVQGALTFSTAELVLRRFTELADDGCPVVLDFSRVPQINSVGARMVAEGLRRLILEGHEILLVDPFNRLPTDSLPEDSPVRVIDELPNWCIPHSVGHDGADLSTR